jgi:hypothetical protein
MTEHEGTRASDSTGERFTRAYQAVSIGKILWSAIAAVVMVVASGAIWGNTRASTAYVDEQTASVARANIATAKAQDVRIDGLADKVNRVESTAAAKSEADRLRDAQLDRIDKKLDRVIEHMMIPPVTAKAPR